MVHYPTDFPSDAAATIIKNYRAGTVASNKAEVAECCWNLAGYGLKSSLGEAGVMAKAQAPGNDEMLAFTDEQAIEALEAHEATNYKDRVVGALPIPAALLAKWAIKFAFALLFS